MLLNCVVVEKKNKRTHLQSTVLTTKFAKEKIGGGACYNLKQLYGPPRGKQN